MMFRVVEKSRKGGWVVAQHTRPKWLVLIEGVPHCLVGVEKKDEKKKKKEKLTTRLHKKVVRLLRRTWEVGGKTPPKTKIPSNKEKKKWGVKKAPHNHRGNVCPGEAREGGIKAMF